MRTVWSPEAEARMEESMGETARSLTSLPWPMKVRTSFLLTMSRTLMADGLPETASRGVLEMGSCSQAQLLRSIGSGFLNGFAADLPPRRAGPLVDSSSSSWSDDCKGSVASSWNQLIICMLSSGFVEGRAMPIWALLVGLHYMTEGLVLCLLLSRLRRQRRGRRLELYKGKTCSRRIAAAQ